MFKRLWEWIKNPHGWGLAVLYVFTALSVGASIAACVKVRFFGYFTYIVYFLAAVLLGYSVYTFVKCAPKIKSGVVKKMKKWEFTGKLCEQYDFRTFVFAICTFSLSVANATFNGTIGIISLSLWYCALGGYYLLLALMRGGVLAYRRKRKKFGASETPSQIKIREINSYRACGIMLVLLPLSLSAVIIETLVSDRAFVRSGIALYVTAAYTFYKITMSVYNFFKARKGDDLSVRAIRNVNLADALVSVFALQTAMFHEFSSGEDFGLANAVTGGAACLLTLILGVTMIVKAYREIKKVKSGAVIEEVIGESIDCSAEEGVQEEHGL